MSGNWTAPAPHGNGPGASQLSKPHGPPYPLTMAIVGGEPSPAIDDPIAVVLLLLFLLSAAAHMAILRINKQRNLKFIFSGMLFALCLLRSVSLVARMIWASYPKTVNAVIAASVMTQCGSVLIFIINLFFAQRVLRAYHPRLGWHRGTCSVVWFLIACVMCCLIMAIVATIHSFFTLDPRVRHADRAVQLFAGSYLAFLAFLPVPVVGLAAAAQHARRFRFHRVEKFGAGKWRAKVGLLVFASLVATLGAAFRVGVNFDGRPGSEPAWFHSRACYYGFNFVTDLVVSTAYLLARFDRRFIVPDGAQGPGDYSPIVPSMHSTSNSHLVGKLPIMGASKPAITARSPLIPTTPTPSLTPEPLTPTPPPTSTTATPTTRADMTPSPFERKQQPVTLSPFPAPSHSHSHSQSQSQSQSQSRSRSQSKSLKSTPLRIRNRGRRAVMLRMRINSEADAYGPDCGTDPLIGHHYHHANSSNGNTHESEGRSSSRLRAPAPAHLGPPILPALDLDLELLSATLLAPWALDSWGFQSAGSRRGSRRESLRSLVRGGSRSRSRSRSSCSNGGGDGGSEGDSSDTENENESESEGESDNSVNRSEGGNGQNSENGNEEGGESEGENRDINIESNDGDDGAGERNIAERSIKSGVGPSCNSSLQSMRARTL
ncbi:hypothetical protein F5Y11DRAFT_359828 [Daldinia sp. FL1419]|nr:hypothetical protein F5Y11DRAFT_359828 [Daldinia sp. FL1419]